MNLQLNNLPVYVADTETQVIDKVVAICLDLPVNSSIALWPDPVGRQIIVKLSKQLKHTLNLVMLGSFRTFDIIEFLQPLCSKFLRPIKKLPTILDLTFIVPRPTTLDYALLTPNVKLMPHSVQTLVDEIGAAYGYERQGTQYRSDVESSESEAFQEPPFTQILLEELVQKTKSFCFVFKGDLYKDCCAAVLECRLGLAGRLLAIITQAGTPVQAVTDVLSSSCLTQIQQPWLQAQFEWSHRAAKMAFCQAAARSGCAVKDLIPENFAKLNITITIEQFTSYKRYVIDDIAQRLKTVQLGLPIPPKSTVLVFSPHPDDDVISAGAAVKALCRQDVELHVAYCVSGAVAVPDSFVMDKINKFKVELALSVADQGMGKQVAFSSAPLQTSTIPQQKQITESTLTAQEAQLRFETGLSPRSKGMLREIEAMTALESMGFFEKSTNQAHCLRLPFYGSGFGRRAPPGEEDVEEVLKLLQEVQPNCILLAGDLSDPHGTHGHCYFVIKDALEIYERDKMASLSVDEQQTLYSVFNTRLIKKGMTVNNIHDMIAKKQIIYKLMYRGAWSEFNVEDSSIIITMSKQEMEEKMITIRHHSSQMGEALYLGGDARAFDIRAKERNSFTAKLLKALGFIEGGDIVGAECYVGCGILP